MLPVRARLLTSRFDAVRRKGRQRGGRDLAVTELLRLLHGGPIHELIDLDLKSPDYRSAVKTQHDFSTLNRAASYRAVTGRGGVTAAAADG